MKNTYLNAVLLVLICAAVMIGCKKESNHDIQFVNNEIELSGVSFNGKWLIFDSGENFGYILNELTEYENENLTENIDDFESQFEDFKSIRSDFKELYEDENLDIDDIISSGVLYSPSEAFSSVISTQGLIQIGDSIFYYTTGNESYIIPATNTNLLLAMDDITINDIPDAISFESSFGIVRKDLEDFGVIVTPVDPGTPGNPIPYLPGGINFCDFTKNPNQPPNTLEFGDFVKYIYKDNNGVTLPTHNGKEVRYEIRVSRHFYLIHNYVSVGMKIQSKNKKNKWKNNLKAEKLKIKACAEGEFTTAASWCMNYPWQTECDIDNNDKKKISKKLDYYTPIFTTCIFNAKLYNLNAKFTGKYENTTTSYWAIW